MKQGFLYEFNCVENGEWIPEKKTFEDGLVEELRFIWKHRYHLERRYIQQHLRGDAAAIWRFKRQQKETRKNLSENSGHTAVIGNLPLISINFWKLGIYRTAKTVLLSPLSTY